MREFIGCDQHKKYSVFVSMDEAGAVKPDVRINNDRMAMRTFLGKLPPHSDIAIETSGHYYWLVEEMEKAGHRPRLAHALEVKKRSGRRNKKTDKEDAQALAMLLRNGTLPEVWIPPAQLRDQREMLRLRMFLSQQRTRVKNRIHGALARYNLQLHGDPYGVEWRLDLGPRLGELPVHTRQSVAWQLQTLDFLEMRLRDVEQWLQKMMSVMAEADLLQTMPCIGPILSMVLTLEIGDIQRFASAEHLASYSGLVPRVKSSGDRTRLGQICGDVNRYLKWAFVEAGNLVVVHRQKLAGSHVLRIYEKVKRKKNHPKAVVAVARHLAEAAYWILKKQEMYRSPQPARKGATRSFVDARVSAERT